MRPVDDRLRLSFDPATEIDIYRSVPHTSPGRAFQLQVPLTVVRGRDSRVVMSHHAKAVARMPNGESLSVPGGRMFPLEQPQDHRQPAGKPDFCPLGASFILASKEHLA